MNFFDLLLIWVYLPESLHCAWFYINYIGASKMITKTHAKAMIAVNGFFLFLNVLFLMLGSSPGVNLFAALFCLCGVICSVLLYNDMK